MDFVPRALAPLLFWWASRLRRAAWERYADSALQPWAVRAPTFTGGLGWRSALDALIWMLFAIALGCARSPVWQVSHVPESLASIMKRRGTAPASQ